MSKILYERLMSPSRNPTDNLQLISLNNEHNYLNFLGVLFESIEWSFQNNDSAKNRLVMLFERFKIYVNEPNNMTRGALTHSGMTSFSVSEFLFSYLNSDSKCPERLRIINRWIFNNYIKPEIAQTLKDLLNDYSDTSHFEEILAVIPIYFSPDFKKRLMALLKHLQRTKWVDAFFKDELKLILMMPWEEIIIRSSALSNFISREYHSILNFILNLGEDNWRIEAGHFPQPILVELTQLIDVYYSNQNEKKKSKQLLSFFNCLYQTPINGLNAFYIGQIEHQNKPYYLLEFLVNIWQAPQDISRTNTLLRWLYDKNPALIVRHKVFEQFYKEQQIDQQFLIQNILGMMSTLPRHAFSTPTSSLLHSYAQTFSLLESNNPSMGKIVESIRQLYVAHWSVIKDTSNDYLRLDSSNEWIRLAQFLAGMQVIPANYYQWLIPTLTDNDVDEIQYEEIVKFPLNYYILSEDGKRLILLMNSLNYHRATGYFYNYNDRGYFPFSALEIDRIRFADPYFASYFKAHAETKIERPICKSTLQLVRDLVQNTLFVEGLSTTDNYPKDKEEKCKKAYTIFLNSLNVLPIDERKNLDNQLITYDNKQLTFERVLFEIIYGLECLTKLGGFFVQLIIDYDPTALLSFSPKFEERIHLEQMRLQSAKKIYKEEMTIDAKTSIHRVLILAVSLFSYKFKGLSNNTIQLADLQNNVTNTASNLFESLKHLLLSGNVSEIPFVYHRQIIPTVNGALENPTWSSVLTRSTTTQGWLKSIKTGELYKETLYFEPAVLLKQLWKTTDKELRKHARSFIDELIITLMQDQNTYLTNVIINVKFIQWLDNWLNDQTKCRFIAQLKTATAPDSPHKMMKLLREFLMSSIINEFQMSNSVNTVKFFKAQHLSNEYPVLASFKPLQNSRPFQSLIIELRQIADTFSLPKNKHYLASLEKRASARMEEQNTATQNLFLNV